jgi:phosphatidylserine decarboxylase
MVESLKKKSGLIAAPGYPFILASVLLVILGMLLHWPWLTVPGLLGIGFFSYFFRDPERAIPPEPGTLVAPADGKVVVVDQVTEDRFLKGPAKRVAIFMNVFDVHVNRAPLAGTVTDLVHRSGAFQAAFRESAGVQNEQQAMLLEDEQGRRVLVVQIAGLLARRIIGYVPKGAPLGKGERFGMICFGSRVDLYLPPEAEILVQAGDRVKAGSSIVARLWMAAA